MTYNIIDKDDQELDVIGKKSKELFIHSMFPPSKMLHINTHKEQVEGKALRKVSRESIWAKNLQGGLYSHMFSTSSVGFQDHEDRKETCMCCGEEIDYGNVCTKCQSYLSKAQIEHLDNYCDKCDEYLAECEHRPEDFFVEAFKGINKGNRCDSCGVHPSQCECEHNLDANKIK